MGLEKSTLGNEVGPDAMIQAAKIHTDVAQSDCIVYEVSPGQIGLWQGSCKPEGGSKRASLAQARHSCDIEWP